MLEYKREKINLESRVQELEKNSTDHDDHIRIVDAWVLQVSPASCSLAALADSSLASARN
jgi:E3 ubiquitin-protein ligase BRE1